MSLRPAPTRCSRACARARSADSRASARACGLSAVLPLPLLFGSASACRLSVCGPAALLPLLLERPTARSTARIGSSRLLRSRSLYVRSIARSSSSCAAAECCATPPAAETGPMPVPLVVVLLLLVLLLVLYQGAARSVGGRRSAPLACAEEPCVGSCLGSAERRGRLLPELGPEGADVPEADAGRWPRETWVGVVREGALDQRSRPWVDGSTLVSSAHPSLTLSRFRRVSSRSRSAQKLICPALSYLPPCSLASLAASLLLTLFLLPPSSA